MRILGIYDDHNCGCAIIEEGRILAAVEEERLSRIKFHNGTTSDGPPKRSLQKVLELTGSGRDQIDRIALAIQPPGELLRDVLYDLFFHQRQPLWILHTLFSKSIRWDRYFLFYAYWYNWSRIVRVKRLLRTFDLDGIPVDYINHHLAHAASAYYTSGRQRALVVTLDGQGDGLSGSVYFGNEGILSPVHRVSSYQSIGLFYNFITWMLGFKPNRHEGKITGLAAYGDPDAARDVFRKLFHMEGPEFQYDLAKRIPLHAFPHRTNYPKLLSAAGGALERYSPEEIAAGVQELTEQSVRSFVGHYVRQLQKDAGGSIPVCMAGGVFANVKVNQRIAELEGVESVYIFPAMGDGGLSAGAALWSNYHHSPGEGGLMAGRRLPDVYLGPAYSESEVENSLKRSNLRFEFIRDIEDRIGELLAEGKVVARFNGRMEYGPRALGNRSILYSPEDASVNDWLNKRLKRTEFMPFAPSSLAECAGELYKCVDHNTFPAEFMTITFDCTPQMAKTCPATVHVDATARPQLVYEHNNSSYYQIIKAFQKRTGLGTIVNTSFNMHEEPIVCTPDDAIRAFKLGHLDYLAIHQFLVSSDVQ